MSCQTKIFTRFYYEVNLVFNHVLREQQRYFNHFISFLSCVSLPPKIKRRLIYVPVDSVQWRPPSHKKQCPKKVHNVNMALEFISCVSQLFKKKKGIPTFVSSFISISICCNHTIHSYQHLSSILQTCIFF